VAALDAACASGFRTAWRLHDEAAGGLRRASRLTSRDLSLENDRDGLPTGVAGSVSREGTPCPQRRSDPVASAAFSSNFLRCSRQHVKRPSLQHFARFSLQHFMCLFAPGLSL